MRYDIEAAMLASERAASVLHWQMSRGRASLAAIASTATSIGILSTVQVLARALRLPEPSPLCDCSGGLSEALVTTAIGLLVTIVALWCHWHLCGNLEKFDAEMRIATLDLATLLEQIE